MRKKIITIALSSAIVLSTVSVGVSEGFNRMPNLPFASNNLESNIVSKQSTTNPLEYTFTISAMGIPQGTVGGQWSVNGVKTGVSGSSFTHTFAHSGDYNVSVTWEGFAQDRPVVGSAETTVHVKSVTPVTPTSLPNLTVKTEAGFAANQTTYDLTANIKGTKAQASGWKYYWVTSIDGRKPNVSEANVVNGIAANQLYVPFRPIVNTYFKAVGPNNSIMKTNTAQLKFKRVEEDLKLKTESYQPGKTTGSYLVSVDTSDTYIDPQGSKSYFVVNGEKQTAQYNESTHSYFTHVSVVAPGHEGAGPKTVQFVSKYSYTLPDGSSLKTVLSNKEVFKYKATNLPAKIVYAINPSIGTTAKDVANQFNNDSGLPSGVASITSQGDNLVFQCKPGYYVPKNEANLTPGEEAVMPNGASIESAVIYEIPKSGKPYLTSPLGSQDWAKNGFITRWALAGADTGKIASYTWAADCVKVAKPVTQVTYTMPSQAKDPAALAQNIATNISGNSYLFRAHLSVKASGDKVTFTCKPGYHVIPGAVGLPFGKYTKAEVNGPINYSKDGSASISAMYSSLSPQGAEGTGLDSYGIASNGGQIAKDAYGNNSYNWTMGCTK